MRFRRPAFLISFILLICSFAFSQVQTRGTDAEQAKKKKQIDELVVQTIDQLVADANALRLPENRAIVLAITGDLYWKYDDKRARELFRNSAAEILAYNFDMEKETRESPAQNVDLGDPGGVRFQVLPLIAKRDAELALEILLQTRPAKLAEAMFKAAQPGAKLPGDVTGYDPAAQRVNQEIALEQQVALLAADEDPDRAIQMIKDSLGKGVSYNVIPLLQKLHKKDEKKALDLAGEVVKKVLDLDMAKNIQDARTALSFLQFNARVVPAAGSKEKQFSFSEAQVKDIATKLLGGLLQMANSMQAVTLMSQAIPVLEKLVPEKIALLKQRHADNQKNMPADVKKMQQRQKLWDQSSTPEDILAQIPKMQNENDKANALNVLVAKIAQIADEPRAKRLIDQIPDDKMRSSALEAFETSRMARLVSTGKLEDARRQIGTLTNRRTQINMLVGLATQFYKKGTEKDVENARSIMKDARGLTNEFPEDGDEVAELMEIVKGYAVIDADAAFRIFETMIEPINEYVQATAVLSRYDKRYREFRKGELVFRLNTYGGNGQLLFRYVPQMQLLAKADLERMSLLSDRFARIDSRMIVKLYVLQGFMKDDKPTAGFGVR